MYSLNVSDHFNCSPMLFSWPAPRNRCGQTERGRYDTWQTSTVNTVSQTTTQNREHRTWAASSTKMCVKCPLTVSSVSTSDVTSVVTTILWPVTSWRAGARNLERSSESRQYLLTMSFTVLVRRSVSYTRSTDTAPRPGPRTYLSKYLTMYSSAALYTQVNSHVFVSHRQRTIS